MHTIDSVRFTSATDGDLTCSCGWQGLASSFAEHRKDAGVAASRESRTRATDAARVDRYAWNRSLGPRSA